MPIMNSLGALVATKYFGVSGEGWISASAEYDTMNENPSPGGSFTATRTKAIYRDASDNLYIGYIRPQSTSADYTRGIFQKLNTEGVSISNITATDTRILSGTRHEFTYNSTVPDASGNYYIIGRNTRLDGSNLYPNWYIAKYDSSDSLVWQNSFYTNTTSTDYAYHSMIDSAGNPYILGNLNWTALNRAAGISKINASTGAQIWTRQISATASDTYINGSVLDSNDNAYIVLNQVRDVPNTPVFHIVKLNSAGTLVTRITINTNLYSIAINGGFIYVASSNGIIKLDTNLSIIDQKQYSTNGWSDARICVSETGTNIIVVGVDSVDSSKMDVVSVDDLLAVNWSNIIQVYNGFQVTKLSGIVISVDGSNFTVVWNSPKTSIITYRWMFAMNLPTNGLVPGNGIYVFNPDSVKYSVNSTTASPTTYTTAASTIGIITISMTAAAPTVSFTSAVSWVSREI